MTAVTEYILSHISNQDLPSESLNSPDLLVVHVPSMYDVHEYSMHMFTVFRCLCLLKALHMKNHYHQIPIHFWSIHTTVTSGFHSLNPSHHSFIRSLLIIQTVSVDEFSSFKQNFIWICWSAHLVFVNAMRWRHSAHAHSLVSWHSADESVSVHECTVMSSSIWLPSYLNITVGFCNIQNVWIVSKTRMYKMCMCTILSSYKSPT